MSAFSRTRLPLNALGLVDAPYPALVQVDADRWMLLAAFSYTKDDGTVYTAPAGMTTDLASIPRALWAILPPFGSYTGAAVIHDFLYQAQPVTKAEADHVLAEAMDCAGVAHVQRQAIYDGVKADGQAAWDKHTAELKAAAAA